VEAGHDHDAAIIPVLLDTPPLSPGRAKPCRQGAAGSRPVSFSQPELTRFLLHDTYAVAFVHGGTFAGGAFPQHTNLPGRRSREGRLPWQHGRRVPGTATTGPGTRPDALLVAGRRVE
jgi:hypothetical protein